MGIFIRIKLNIKAIIRKTGALISVVYTIVGFIFICTPLEDIVSKDISKCQKIWIGLLILALIALVAFVVSCISCLCKTKSIVIESNSQHKVYVKFGDFFFDDIVGKDYHERINKVVCVNRCFDTIVDDSLISHQTMHGKVMQHLYDNGIFTQTDLNETIQKTLIGKDYIELEASEKKEGNIKRYSAGTIAEVQINDKLTYFFLGLSEFDKNLRASTSKSDYAYSIQKLIEFCDSRSQGYPVVLSLIGSGLSRTNVKSKDILDYLIASFKINKDIINCDFYIVIPIKDKNKLSISNL